MTNWPRSDGKIRVKRRELVFGSSDAIAATETMWLPSVDQNGHILTLQASGVLQESVYLVVRPGYIHNLVVFAETAPGGATTYIFLVYVNNVATAITVTLTAAEITGSDLINAVAVVPGDRISIRCVALAASAGSLLSASLCYEVTG